MSVSSSFLSVPMHWEAEVARVERDAERIESEDAAVCAACLESELPPLRLFCLRIVLALDYVLFDVPLRRLRVRVRVRVRCALPSGERP